MTLKETITYLELDEKGQLLKLKGKCKAKEMKK